MDQDKSYLLLRAATDAFTQLNDISAGYKEEERHEPLSATIARLKEALAVFQGVDDCES